MSRADNVALVDLGDLRKALDAAPDGVDDFLDAAAGLNEEKPQQQPEAEPEPEEPRRHHSGHRHRHHSRRYEDEFDPEDDPDAAAPDPNAPPDMTTMNEEDRRLLLSTRRGIREFFSSERFGAIALRASTVGDQIDDLSLVRLVELEADIRHAVRRHRTVRRSGRIAAGMIRKGEDLGTRLGMKLDGLANYCVASGAITEDIEHLLLENNSVALPPIVLMAGSVLEAAVFVDAMNRQREAAAAGAGGATAPAPAAETAPAPPPPAPEAIPPPPAAAPKKSRKILG